MEAKTQGEEEEKRWKDRERLEEEKERAERSTESTIHTVPELLIETQRAVPPDPDQLRREMELQLESWQRQAPGDHQEVHTHTHTTSCHSIVLSYVGTHLDQSLGCWL